MGQFRNGDFYPSAEGLAMAEIEDVVIKAETPAKVSRKKADKDPVDPIDPVADDQLSIEL
jgi:hypothetical protein